LFEVEDYPDRYDVSPDGSRFVVLRRDSGSRAGTPVKSI
jgi:hypothetical protein